jgi:hypothetical protein
MCWKYQGTPYQLMLQEAGALYQTMYLAATALGLAPCAVGAFPELAVAEVLDLDPKDEPQVGLFALGVPELDPRERPTVAVRTVVLRPESPFSAEPDQPGVALELADGRTEIQELGRILLVERADGRFECPALRGRYRAVLEPADAATLEGWKRR